MSSGRTKEIIKNLKWIIGVAILVFSITATFFVTRDLLSNGLIREHTNISGKTIEHGLKNISELNAAEYHYTHVEVIDRSKSFFENIAIPLTNTKVIYSYDGVVTSGIDFSKIEVKKRGNKLKIILPNATITSSEIDPDSFELYDERNNIFNPLSINDINLSIADMKTSEESTAIEKGLYTWAENNARTIIENFLRSTYNVEDCEIEFEILTESSTETTEP